MADAKRDQNRQTVGLAWDATNTTTKPLLVDPSTGRLLITVTTVSAVAPSTYSQQIDENRIKSALVVTDNAATDVKPLLIDSRNDLLWVDIVVE